MRSLLIVGILFSLGLLTTAQVIVDTVYGQVQGQTVGLNTGVNVNSFWAVPFGKAPVGDLRFAVTEEPDPWDEVFIANTLGSACPHISAGAIWWTHPLWDDFDEDCLHLNIFTPEDMSGEYPVMIWFHGGAYVSGANIQYPGHFFAGRDVVVVVANYRLGNLGFFSAEGDDYNGNWAMYDQRQAMVFVQENIANFGGDPDRVTIFGQSAGASSVSLHLVSPLSQGLFQQVIGESGNEFTFWAVNWPEQDPDEYGRQVAEKCNCTTDDTEEMITCLREVDADTLTKTSFDCAEGYFCQGMAPVIDGPGGFLPDHPWTLRDEGEWMKGPLIQGQTTEDGSLYTLSLIPESADGGFTREEFEYYLRNNILSIWAPQFDDDTFEDAFEAINWYYSPWPHVHDEDLNREAFNILITDGAFGYTGDRQIKYQQTEQADVWHYLFGFLSPNSTTLFPEWMGAPHMAELPYVWGYPLLQINPEVRDDANFHFDIIDWTVDEDIPYAEFVITAWANFAKTGNPNTPDELEPPFGNVQSDWPVYNTDTYDYYYFDYLVEPRDEYRQRNFAFYTEYMSYILDKDLLATSSGQVSGSRLRSDHMAKFMSDYAVNHWKKTMPEFDFDTAHDRLYK